MHLRRAFNNYDRADGSIERFKATLVGKGFTQLYRIDYQETFAHIAKLTVRFQLSIAVIKIGGDLEKEVHMTILTSLEIKSNSGLVCKLEKSLYGLKQSPRAWFLKNLLAQ